MSTIPKKLVIVGGVAGGASAAARARRLDEHCEIVVFERGAFVSFANCGLPYHVGNVIVEEQDLLLMTPERFHSRFRIDVRIQQEVVAIDRERRCVAVRDRISGEVYEEDYDALVLSPGAKPLPIPGVSSETPGVFTLGTVPDARNMRAYLQAHRVTEAVVIGGGFIGLEMVENLHRRGLSVTLVEAGDRLLKTLDVEMTAPLEQRLRENGVRVVKQARVTGVAGVAGALEVTLDSGAVVDTQMVVLCAGVRPASELAEQAGLAIGEHGGIVVDATLRTSDPHIWAVGDVVEVLDRVTEQTRLLSLAGPANRQGRIAADCIFGRERVFKGVQATSICGCMGLAAAATGASEAALQAAGITDYEAIYLHPFNHVTYYPGAKVMNLKVLFARGSGLIYGAQAIGEEGIDRRIDVFALAISQELSVFDLEDLELCYAPQYGSAKDPVNLAGFIASNLLRGDMPAASWQQVLASRGEGLGVDMSYEDHVLLDVRTPAEHAGGAVPGALHVPLDELRERTAELPRDKELWVYCAAGQRSYYATRLLMQRGFRVRNLSGGYKTFQMITGMATQARAEAVLSHRRAAGE